MDPSEEGEQTFKGDRKTQDAVIRNLEIFGEATKGLSDAVRAQNPDLPWSDMAGVRDKLIHDCAVVDVNIVWNVLEQERPVVHDAASELLVALAMRDRHTERASPPTRSAKAVPDRQVRTARLTIHGNLVPSSAVRHARTA